jgi:hypothetical protein
MLYLIFVRLTGWMALFARSAAAKLLVLRQEVILLVNSRHDGRRPRFKA